MSFRATDHVWHAVTEIRGDAPRSGGTRLLLMLAIAGYAKDNGRDAFPATSVLMRKTGLTRGTVLRTLQQLAASGHLVIDRQGARRYLHLTLRGLT